MYPSEVRPINYTVTVLYTHASLHNRSVYEYYAHGSTYDELHTCNRLSRHLWDKYIPDTSFKFLVTAYNHKVPKSRQKEVIEGFSYMEFLGKIDMLHPEIPFVCFEECNGTFSQ
jgi:tRNA (guanine10-N2)-methyltransferase